MDLQRRLFGKALSRRDFLVKGVGGAAATVASLSPLSTTIVNAATIAGTPALEEGPYWVETLLQRQDIRSDPTTGAVMPGYPMLMQFNIFQIVGSNLYNMSNAIVDVWQASPYGLYSDETSEGTYGQKYLRGLQVTNAYGQASFLTVYPGWYSGRAVHFHYRLRIFDTTTYAIVYNFVSQVFFNDTTTTQIYDSIYPYTLRTARDTFNTSDRVYTGASAGNEITSNAGAKSLANLTTYQYGCVAQFSVLINLSDSNYNNFAG